MPHSFDMPLYEIGEAAKYIHLDVQTLKNFMRPRLVPVGGTQRNIALLQCAEKDYLSFYNLVDAFVISELHLTEGVALSKIYEVKAIVGQRHSSPYLFASHDLVVTSSALVAGRGPALESALGSILGRVAYEDGHAARLYPFLKGSTQRLVFLAPDHGFGKPVVSEQFVSTRLLARRQEYGDKLEVIAKDYGIAVNDVLLAIQYQRQVG